jgi:hypothetical protein
MVKIINPMRGPDPVASAIAGLGKALFSGDSTSDAIQREQLRKLQRENVETEAMMRLITDKGGVQNLGADPVAQALMIANGYNPNDFGRLGAIGAATGSGPRDPSTTAWLTGMGEYNATPEAFDIKKAQEDAQFAATLAETIRNNNMSDATERWQTEQTIAEDQRQFNLTPEPALKGGVPVFGNRADLVSGGYSPILTGTEFEATERAKVIDDPNALAGLNDDQMLLMGVDRGGENADTVRNLVTPSGNYLVTDASLAQHKDVRGNPLPTPLHPQSYIGSVQATSGKDLTAAVQTDLQSDVLATNKFNALLAMAKPLTADPALFGPVGNLRSKVQNIFQTVNGTAEAVGAQQILATTLKDSVTGQPLGAEGAAALIPELYDSRLSEVETLWGLLVYQGAMALAGQQGRSVSDADVLQMRSILGDPQSFFASNLAMRTKLDIAEKVVNAYARLTKEALDAGTVTPGADTAAPAGDIPTLSPEEAAKLPPGTQFRGLDGKIRVTR